jgi:hypothetical protein
MATTVVIPPLSYSLSFFSLCSNLYTATDHVLQYTAVRTWTSINIKKWRYGYKFLWTCTILYLTRPVRSKYVQADLIWGRIQRKTWCMGPYAVVDYDLTLSRLQSRLNTFGMGNPLPGSTLALCQSRVSRLYPVRNLGFGLWSGVTVLLSCLLKKTASFLLCLKYLRMKDEYKCVPGK